MIAQPSRWAPRQLGVRAVPTCVLGVVPCPASHAHRGGGHRRDTALLLGARLLLSRPVHASLLRQTPAAQVDVRVLKDLMAANIQHLGGKGGQQAQEQGQELGAAGGEQGGFTFQEVR